MIKPAQNRVDTPLSWGTWSMVRRTPVGVLAVVRTQPLPGDLAPSGVKPAAAENRGLDEFPQGGKWYYEYRFSLEKKNPK